MDTQELASRRARAERAARIPLIVGLVALPPCVAVVIWVLGFSASPHHVGYAFTVGGITAIILGGPHWPTVSASSGYASWPARPVLAHNRPWLDARGCPGIRSGWPMPG